MSVKGAGGKDAGFLLRRATRSDIPEITSVFARAFFDAALYRWLEPNAERRPGFLQMVFERRVPHGFDDLDGEVAIVDGKIAGAALWMRPGAAHTPNEALEDAVRRYGGGADEKWRRFHNELFALFDSVYAAPHWNLAPIAVLNKGAGLGGALIRNKLAQIDSASGADAHGGADAACIEGVQFCEAKLYKQNRQGRRFCGVCVIGTQDAANLAIYKRFGWEEAGKTRIYAPDGAALDSWAMVRLPANH